LKQGFDRQRLLDKAKEYHIDETTKGYSELLK
jgi:hypothetical protein